MAFTIIPRRTAFKKGDLCLWIKENGQPEWREIEPWMIGQRAGRFDVQGLRPVKTSAKTP